METEYIVNETFYSLKGEGLFTGTPMFFIRLSGCNLNCSFCDTMHQTGESRTVSSLVEEACSYPSNIVVITGGEPLMHNVLPLAYALVAAGRKLHLETNGSRIESMSDQYYAAVRSQFRWIACSPKSPPEKLAASIIRRADELKFLVGGPGWEQYITSVRCLLAPFGKLLVMPLSEGKHEGIRGPEDLIPENTKLATDYCLAHPEFSLCVQMHKVLSIR